MLATFHLKLIAEWRSFWRMWSLRLTALGTALLGWMLASPDMVLNAWNILPPELKAVIPQQYMMYITFMLFVAAMFSRLIKQDAIPKAKTDGTI